MSDILKIRDKVLEAMNLLQANEDETHDSVKGEAWGILDEVFDELGKIEDVWKEVRLHGLI